MAMHIHHCILLGAYIHNHSNTFCAYKNYTNTLGLCKTAFCTHVYFLSIFSTYLTAPNGIVLKTSILCTDWYSTLKYNIFIPLTCITTFFLHVWWWLYMPNMLDNLDSNTKKWNTSHPRYMPEDDGLQLL